MLRRTMTPRQAQDMMQSEMEDFVPDATVRRTGRNISVVFDSGLFPA